MSPESVLRAVTSEPSSATEVYRRRELLLPQKSLTTRHRKRRRACARVLETLAAEGRIERSEGDSEGHPVPVYWRKPPRDTRSREDRFLDTVDDLQTDRRERLGR